MPKRSLRQRMLAQRKALAAEEVRSLSHCVQEAFMASEEFARAEIVALYAAIHNEVDTAVVMQEALTSGKMVLYPVVFRGGLVFRRITDPMELRSGTFGVLEPDASCDSFDPRAAGVIVVPGVAFDKAGKRVGYGKGYYDRTLHMLEGSGKLVGFCYDFQLIDEIVGEPHDVKMDMIVTETKVVRPRA